MAIEALAAPFLALATPDVESSLAALVLRLFLGFLMIVHGAPKLKDLKGTMGWVKGTGWTWGASFAVLFAFLEVFGGLAIVLGFLTRPVAVLFVLEMLATTTFSKAKLGKKLVLGYELDLLYLGIALALVVLGGGMWAIDIALGL